MAKLGYEAAQAVRAFYRTLAVQDVPVLNEDGVQVAITTTSRVPAEQIRREFETVLKAKEAELGLHDFKTGSVGSRVAWSGLLTNDEGKTIEVNYSVMVSLPHTVVKA